MAFWGDESLIVLLKIMADEVEALVVAPLWITQSCWPQLAHLIVNLPPTRKIWYQPHKVRKAAKIRNRYNQVPQLI